MTFGNEKVSPFTIYDQAAARARINDAALELLAALKEAQANLSAAAAFFEEGSHEERELRRLAANARAAIAKAEGR